MGLARRVEVSVLGLGLVTALAGGCATEGADSPCAQPGTACSWAGNGERGFNIDNPSANRLESKLYFPEDLTFAADGRGYIVDWNNHRIRRVEPNDNLVTVVGTDYEGDGSPEMEDRLPVCNPAGAPGTKVALNHPTDARFGPDGLLYIAAWHNNKIRVFDPATDVVTTLAGDSYGYAGDGGPACSAAFNQPKSVAISPEGTVYTIDQRNVRIRALQPASAGGTIATIAGTGSRGNIGDGGLALDAQFGFDTNPTPQPTGGLLYADGALFVADSLNNRIRRINLATGVVDCIAGSQDAPDAGYSGDGGSALQAKFNGPLDLELGPDGRIYVADTKNNVIRAIDLTTGIIETVAGTGTKCDVANESCPDQVPALQMQFNEPYGIAFDPAGNLYVADTHNNRIVKITR